jgi:lipid-binding SYLF domain-containing protein
VVDGLHPLNSSQDVNRSYKPDETTSWNEAVQDHRVEAPRRKKWKTILVIAGVLAIGFIVGGAVGGAVGGTAATKEKANAVTTTMYVQTRVGYIHTQTGGNDTRIKS